MPLFRCVIAQKSGSKQELLQHAMNEAALLTAFSGSDQFLVAYKIIDEDEAFKSKKRFSREAVLEFTEIMAVLLQAGNTIKDALTLCASLSSSRTGLLCQGLLAGITRGEPFHRVLALHAASFSPLYQALVRLGEKTGSVASVFERMCRFLRMERKIREKLSNALMYPLFILAVALSGSLGILFFVMPRLTEIFSAFTTGENDAVHIEIGNIYRSLWLSFSFMLLLSAALFLCLLLRRKYDAFALVFDRFLLRLPVIGSLATAIQTLDFSFAMEMLTGAGITVGNALFESAPVVRNRAYKEAVLAVHAALLKGEKLSAAFIARKEFPPYIGTWITVGERTGSVEPVFSQIRAFFQNNVEYTAEKLMHMIEPVLTVITGLIVLFMVVQFVLPVFSLYGTVL